MTSIQILTELVKAASYMAFGALVVHPFSAG